MKWIIIFLRSLCGNIALIQNLLNLSESDVMLRYLNRPRAPEQRYELEKKKGLYKPSYGHPR
jgi:hypothetical protein